MFGGWISRGEGKWRQSIDKKSSTVDRRWFHICWSVCGLPIIASALRLGNSSARYQMFDPSRIHTELWPSQIRCTVIVHNQGLTCFHK